MSDYKRGVPIQLDRVRYLRITARDARELAELKIEDGMEQLIHVMFVALRRDDPSLTEDAVWDLVDMNEIPLYNQKLSEAMGGKPEGVKDDVTVPLANSDQTSQS